MNYAIAFAAPDKVMSLNDRPTYYQRSRQTRTWKDAAIVHAVNAINRRQLARMLPYSIVTVDFPVARVDQRRDPSNLLPTVKAIVDGFVVAGVWPDDSSREVLIAEPVVHDRALDPNIIVRIHTKADHSHDHR